MARSADQPVEQFFQWSLLGLLASGFCALVASGYLDLPTTILTGTGLVLRAILVAGGQRLEVKQQWIAALTIVYIGFYPIDYAYFSREFIPATVHLICFLAVLRVLTAQSDRDYFFVKVIAFLELLAATLLSASISFFIFLSLFVVFGVATLCCTEIRHAARAGGRVVGSTASFHGRLTALTAGVTVSVVVLTAGLFFLLPRTARAAFRSLVSERYHLPGFSGEVSLGQIGELQQKTTPLMHVRIEGVNERLALKWRGAALSQFDGKRWFNPRAYGEPIRVRKGLAILASDPQRRRRGERINYEVKIRDIGTDVLFFAGIPEFVQTTLPIIFRASGESYRTGLALSDGSHYFAFSYLPERSRENGYQPEPLPLARRTENLLLPSLDPRIHRLASDLGQASTPKLRAQNIERYLRTNYSYTTELLQDPVPDPLANFLFDRKKGHCEYFASSMAVMLRSIGIPARVITGFQSGVYNPFTRWHLIRASDAHSWVEAWMPGEGWTVFDPTPPDQRGQTPAVFWSKWALYLDAADMFWQQWVMQYDIDQQLTLAARLRQPDKLLNVSSWFERVGGSTRAAWTEALRKLQPHLSSLMFLLGAALMAIVFGPRSWKLWQARRHSVRIRRGRVGAGDASVLYARMLQLLRRRGWDKPAWLTPLEFARAIPDSPVSGIVEEATLAYNDLRYAGHPDAAGRMLTLLRKLESVK